jgi:type IV secretion system protein VirB5
MKMWKGFVASLLVAASMCGSKAANAGIPVIDAANLAQSIQQVIAWAQQQIQMGTQIANQATQIQNQVTQIARITGSRNLGQVFNNPLLQSAVPANVGTVMSNISTQGFNGLTQPAQALRTATMIYNCMDLNGQSRINCQAKLSTNAQATAYQTNALQIVTQRVQEIQNMQQQINATADPMAINQVQAALAAETAQVANDQNRLRLMEAHIATAQASVAQAETERNLAMMVQNAPTSAQGLVFP